MIFKPLKMTNHWVWCITYAEKPNLTNNEIIDFYKFVYLDNFCLPSWGKYSHARLAHQIFYLATLCENDFMSVLFPFLLIKSIIPKWCQKLLIEERVQRSRLTFHQSRPDHLPSPEREKGPKNLGKSAQMENGDHFASPIISHLVFAVYYQIYFIRTHQFFVKKGNKNEAMKEHNCYHDLNMNTRARQWIKEQPTPSLERMFI
jgi:hypothetical protein